MVLTSSLAPLAIRSKSALRCSASAVVSAVVVDSSAGHRPPITHGVQSIAELKVGNVRDSRVALRRRWRAVFRPKIPTGQAYWRPRMGTASGELCGWHGL